MGLLEDNLKLGLEAVKYAKENIARSANQYYFKTLSPFKDKERNQFLLTATRGGAYRATWDDNGGFDKYVKSDEIMQRRKQLELLIASPMDKKLKQKKIDEYMKAWGANYFKNGSQIGQSAPGAPTSAFQLRSEDERYKKVAKVLGKSQQEVKTILEGTDDVQIDFIIKIFLTKFSADNAKKFGVGNCMEKGELAALYLMDQSPGGIRLALYCLEEQHKGLTGLVTGAGGDHLFAVYGHDSNAANIGALGPNAIIVDGWMNDAYPAQRFLTPKHGLNYNNVRINLKQFTTRNMVCVSYRSHVRCCRDFGVLGAGRRQLTPPTISRKNF